MDAQKMQIVVQKLQEKKEGLWQEQEVLFLREKESISLITEYGRELIREDYKKGIRGFCHGRFKGNMEVSVSKDLQIRDMKEKDQITGLEVILTIQQVGKRCYDHCPIYTRKGCGFLREILFLEVQKPGRITAKEKLSYRQRDS